MRIFKRYVLRDKDTKQIIDTIIVEAGKLMPKVNEKLYIAECIGKYEKPKEDSNEI